MYVFICKSLKWNIRTHRSSNYTSLKRIIAEYRIVAVFVDIITVQSNLLAAAVSVMVTYLTITQFNDRRRVY